MKLRSRQKIVQLTCLSEACMFAAESGLKKEKKEKSDFDLGKPITQANDDHPITSLPSLTQPVLRDGVRQYSSTSS